MIKIFAGVTALFVTASAGLANAPTTSLRPVARIDVFPVAIQGFAPASSLRPVLRPANVRVAAATPPPPKPVVGPNRKASSARVGKLCGDRNIQGVLVGRVPGKLAGCGVSDAVKVYSVSGVKLSTPSTMDCRTAGILNGWVSGGMAKAVGGMGGGVREIKVAAHYSCRTRNNKPGAKISEHGKGKAIDMSAFYLHNGDTISVLNDWNNGRKGRILRDMHRTACGPFGTVLGPDERYHKDHFHFDTANYRSGAYCR